jgi:hypothetical protein
VGSRGRFVVNGFALVEESLRSVSPGPDGEGVGVVAQDRPLSPDLPAFVAFQPAAVQSVATFEVADAAFLASSVAPQSALGAFGLGFLAASDEHLLRCQLCERVVGRARLEATIDGHFARGDPEALKL